MSFFGSIGRIITGAAGGFLTGGIPGAVAGGAAGILRETGSSSRAAPPSIVLPGVGTVPGFGGGQFPIGTGAASSFALPAVIPPIARQAGTVIAGAAGGVLAQFAGGQAEKPKRRRMNFGNAKAARRSIRRIKGARKLLQDIEKQLPKVRTRSRSVPQHHHHGGHS